MVGASMVYSLQRNVCEKKSSLQSKEFELCKCVFRFMYRDPCSRL